MRQSPVHYLFQKWVAKAFLLSFLLILFCSAGESDYTLLKSIPLSKATFLTTDKLGNAYVIFENQLLQFDPKGNSMANFSEKNIGELTFVDAGNPLKLLLFYPDFARLIVLDSKLSIQRDIDLRLLKINQPIVVCNSAENGYWIYDRDDDQLKNIDFNMQVIHQSGNLTQMLGYQVQPVMITEDNGYIYMNNPKSGILVFDRFGAYYKNIPYKNLENFQVVDKNLLFINKNKFFRYDFKSLAESEVLLPVKDTLRTVRIEQHQLYLLTSDLLNFYSF
jgi:hypothetical protein